MEPMDVEITQDGTTQQSPSVFPVPSARKYQLEALETAMKQNTIVFLETGSGKTLIAIMLLKNYACLLKKPSRFFAVFLAPTVPLVQQQSEALMKHTDLKVGKYWGGKGINFRNPASWSKEVNENQVLVMTPEILLAALRHSCLKIEMIKVLIFDECHNARGKHPYACIMMEFYHQKMNSTNSNLPRILGMTASPIKGKDCRSESDYWQQIHELENLMHSKIYTCTSESVLAEYIPSSTPERKFYEHRDIPHDVFKALAIELNSLRKKHEYSLRETILLESMAEAKKNLDEMFWTLLFCLTELGVFFAFKAAEFLSSRREDILPWEKVDVHGKNLVKNFCLEASKILSAGIQSVPSWNSKADWDAGYLTSKVTCLIESLLEYREVKDMRCIIFVERIITAIVLKMLLNELLPELTGWQTAYAVGYNSRTRSQSRSEQNRIIDEFRNGKVNIIVATSMLEEGLDVQSCNLVIRFDLPTSVCSFIQSRGRARMLNSHFLIMLKSGDDSALARVDNFLASGEIMRQQSLMHTSVPIAPLDYLPVEAFYEVEATGAVVNLSSSAQLLEFYCSKLPNDGYFKVTSNFTIDPDSQTGTLDLPRGCPIPTVSVNGSLKQLKQLKQLACLEACKQLHQIGALSDHLLPDIVEETKEAQQINSFKNHIIEQVKYVPPELVACASNDDSRTLYHCYLIELEPNFNCHVKPQNIMLALRTRPEFDDETSSFDLDVNNGSLKITLRYHSVIELNPEEVLRCQNFQVTVLRVLIDHKLDMSRGVPDELRQRGKSTVLDYLLLPTTGSHQHPLIDWECVNSVEFSSSETKKHLESSPNRCHGHLLRTLTDSVCSCMLENSLVVTPHNGILYCISEILHALDGNSSFELNKGGGSTTYKAYYKRSYNISLEAIEQPLLKGSPVFSAKNYLQRCTSQNAKEARKTTVELPPELCKVVMSPMSIALFYSFSFAPSIMHRIESLLLAATLKRMLVDHCMQNDVIPTMKVLEAITTNNCQENFNLETLETLGDSFLKYVISQQLFKTNQNDHKGLLTIKRKKKVSNVPLSKRGCDNKILGFIRDEQFDPKTWIIPGDNGIEPYTFEGEYVFSRKIFYDSGKRTKKINSKTVANVVEALIGSFLNSGGEFAALSFMEWLGIKADFICRHPYYYTMPLRLNPEMLVNIEFFESLLNYKFQDTSLLVEALTHGSCGLREIPRSYQRLEFLGDAVLDFVVTKCLHDTYPGLSPGLITKMRSVSVNNDWYAQSAVKVGLHEHILHNSQELQRDIASKVRDFQNSSCFGWESEIELPGILADIVESIGGAIYVDSGYDHETVFRSMRPLFLEPMVTPETLKLHPVMELNELCQKENLVKIEKKKKNEANVKTFTLEITAKNGPPILERSRSASNLKMAERFASKDVLKWLKENYVRHNLE